MAVERESVIDLIGVESSSGRVILTLADQLDREDLRGHLTMLQARLYAYATFVETGELRSTHPASDGRPVAIRIVFRLPPPEAAVATKAHGGPREPRPLR